MSRNTFKSARLPKGKYFVGDPCYVIQDKEWDEVGEATGWFGADASINAKEFDGTFMTKNGMGFADSTAWGDGCYTDIKGKFYIPVDSGLIGLVPFTDDMEFKPYLGQVVEFEHDFDVEAHKGSFVFDKYVIETGGDE